MLSIRRRGRAIGFLFFVLVMFPVLMAGLGISADIGRIIIANRQVSETADAAALAGASAFNTDSRGSATVNASDARSAARATYNEAIRVGPTGSSMMPMAERPRMARPEVINSDRAVRVRITYNLSGFVAMDFLASIARNGAGGNEQGLRFTVERTANICDSSTGAFCTYPVRS